MNKKVFVHNINITLEAGVTMERADELHKLLVKQLSDLASTEQALERVTVDLSEVSDIDACGCQLLALFAENLKRRGITPITAVGSPIAERIDLLGFSDLLAAPPARS